MPKRKKKNKNQGFVKSKGTIVILQQMSEQVDGKIHFVAGVDQHVFNIEDGDKFFTATFTVDPFN